MTELGLFIARIVHRISCFYFKNEEWTKVHDIQLAKEILVSEPYCFKPTTV